VIANSITHLTVEAELEITRDDMAKCKQLAKRSDIFEVIIVVY